MMGWHCGVATQRTVSTVEDVGASGRRRSILRVHCSSPLRQSVCAYSERERRAGRRQCVDVMYVCHSICQTDHDNNVNLRPLTLKPTLDLYDLLWICCITSCGLVVGVVDMLWTCCWCAVFDLVFVQNGEHRRFG